MATALEQLRYIDEQLAAAALPPDQAELVRLHRLTGLQLRNQRLQGQFPTFLNGQLLLQKGAQADFALLMACKLGNALCYAAVTSSRQRDVQPDYRLVDLQNLALRLRLARQSTLIGRNARKSWKRKS